MPGWDEHVGGTTELSKQLSGSWYQLSMWAGWKGSGPIGKLLYISFQGGWPEELGISDRGQVTASAGNNIDGRKGVFILCLYGQQENLGMVSLFMVELHAPWGLRGPPRVPRKMQDCGHGLLCGLPFPTCLSRAF